MAARIALTVVALLACAWFGLGIVQTHDTLRAQTLLSAGNTLDASQARHVSSLLDAASVLNPDRQVQELRGQLAAERGEAARAQEILQGVVRAEPRNLAAWYLVAQYATNGTTYRAALTRVDRLLRSFPTHR